MGLPKKDLNNKPAASLPGSVGTFFLTGLAFVFAFVGFYFFANARSVMHENGGLLAFVSAAVCSVGSVISSHLSELRAAR